MKLPRLINCANASPFALDEESHHAGGPHAPILHRGLGQPLLRVLPKSNKWFRAEDLPWAGCLRTDLNEYIATFLATFLARIRLVGYSQVA